MLLYLLLACANGDDGTSGTRKGPSEDTSSGSDTDTQSDSGGDPDVETVEVAHDRELRGAWVATVWNINFPTSTGAEAQQAELEAMVNTLADQNFNAIFFQVRPEGDALYDSALEPWSRYLTGTQGQDPGYDPLATLISLAHHRGLEVHAWLNPYRAKASASSTAVSPHATIDDPTSCLEYGSYVWMDPGAPSVQARTEAVIVDLVERYDLDGVHFDDYFYPYPTDVDFPDDATFAAYGGGLDRDDWRRANVNKLVASVSAAIDAADPTVRFGISPFGLYRNGVPEGTWGFDPYEGLYADALHWVEEGQVDYLAPQLYWPSTSEGQAYGTLVDWWATSVGAHGRLLFPGNYLAKLGTDAAYSPAEFATQVRLTREAGGQGNIWYHVDPLLDDTEGIRATFAELYPSPVLTPPLATASGTVAPPKVEQSGATLTLSHAERVRAWAVYGNGADTRTLDRLVPGEETTVTLPAGSWAVSAVTRDGLESRGVVVVVE